MNDAEVTKDVRECFNQVHLETSLETVVSRGRSLRHRRRFSGAAVTAAVVASAVGVAVAGILPGPGPKATLDAWTATVKPAGLVAVTIRQLSDPAGLQRTLRADGVPTFVRFQGQEAASCLYYPQRSGAVLRKVLASQYDGPDISFTIDPAAIPSGAALWIQVMPETTNSSGIGSSGMSGELVYASGRCPTGSGGG
jgi:hypothetical protein